MLIYDSEMTPMPLAQDSPTILVKNVPGYVLFLTQILSGPINSPF